MELQHINNAISFLTDMTKYKGEKPLTIRQKEFFLFLYDISTSKASAGGYSASELIKRAYYTRFDLNNEEQEEWLEQKISFRQNVFLTDPEWRFLLHICCQLEIIYPDEYIPLDSYSLKH